MGYAGPENTFFQPSFKILIILRNTLATFLGNLLAKGQILTYGRSAKVDPLSILCSLV